MSLFLYDIPSHVIDTLSPLSHHSILDAEPEVEIELNGLDISASEGSSSDLSEDDRQDGARPSSPPLNTIYENGSSEHATEETPDLTHIQGSPYVLYTSSNPQIVPEEKCLAVFKVMLNPDKIATEPVQALRELNKDKHSIIMMIGGGHFAAAVFSHKRQKHGPPIILDSKSFHRYTTRRKQGGSQSASDNARGKANSAGSSLRRYNEAALEKEVRELLQSWKTKYIDNADMIFVRANGRSNRGILMNYDKAPILSSDKRLRSIPFTTKRATSTEVRRVWSALTTVRQMDIPKPDEAKLKEKQKQKEKELERQLKEKQKEEQRLQQQQQQRQQLETPAEKHTNEITSLIKKGRTPRLVAYFRQNKLSADFNFEPKSKYQHTHPNALFYSSAQGQHHMVFTLLTTLGADPVRQNAAGKTAAQYAADSDTVHAFQMARHAIGEDKWDWNAANVGPGMSREQLAQIQDQKKREEMDQRKEQMSQLLKEEQNSEKASTQRLTNVVTKLSQDAALRDMSPELRLKLERERRARAAEARFKR